MLGMRQPGLFLHPYRTRVERMVEGEGPDVTPSSAREVEVSDGIDKSLKSLCSLPSEVKNDLIW